MYEIKKVGSVAVVFCTNHKNPISQLSKIEQDLGGFTGKVIFDLLLCNGNSSNRFVEAQISQGKVNRGSMKVMDGMDLNDIVIAQIEIFCSVNAELITKSVILSDKEKKFLLSYERFVQFER